MNIEALAARAGVAKVSLYRRWPTKVDIVADVLSDMRDDVEIPDLGSLEAELRGLIQTSVAHTGMDQEARFFLRTLGEVAEIPELSAVYLQCVLEPRMRQIQSLLRRATTRGEFGGEVSDTVAALIIGGSLVMSYVAVVADAELTLGIDEVENLVQAILRAIKASELIAGAGG
jgi:AcrR family transcriptional regulator